MNSGRNTVVIGGANGIGRAVAQACEARGDQVLVADIEESADILACDVTSSESVLQLAQTAVARFGSVDFVFHAAGVLASGRTSLATSLDTQRWVIEVNLMGTINVLTAFAPILIAQSTPSAMVVTGSEHSVGVPHTNSAAYTASKHAVLGYADVVRRELPDHVKLSVLCPGIVSTSLWRSSERRQDTFGGARPAREGSGAVMELGISPDEVAQSVLRGVDAGEFLIMTHDHLVTYARERYELVADAIKRQVPDQGGKYETTNVMAEFNRRNKG